MENVPFRQLPTEITLAGSGNLGTTQTLSTDNLQGGFEIKSIRVNVLAESETIPAFLQFTLFVGNVQMFNRIMLPDRQFPQLFHFYRSFALPIFVNGLILATDGVRVLTGLGGQTGTYYAQLTGSYVPRTSVVTVPQSLAG